MKSSPSDSVNTATPQTRPGMISPIDWIVSFCLTGVILVTFLATTPELRHWMVFPVFLSGWLIGSDAVRVFFGRANIFRATSLVALVGYHMFFLAPLLHVRWDYWLPYVRPPEDWRLWLGRMAIINVVGLMLYLMTSRLALNNKSALTHATSWRLDISRFWPLLIACLSFTFLLQAAVYAAYGGISGYISAFEEERAFKGLGAVFFLSESFPMIVLMGFAVWITSRKTQVTLWQIILILAAFFTVRLLFGGLRGSRGNLVWAMFWALGLIHLTIRPLTGRMVSLFGLSGLAFMYIYGFYKAFGSDTFNMLLQPGGLAQLQEESGRSVNTLILGDLSRADVQAFLLHQLSRDGLDLQYAYAWGESYLSAVTDMIPESLFPLEVRTKVDFGTFVMQGGRASILSHHKDSRVYGVSGEALLNFGYWAIPFAYAVWGFLVGLADRWSSSLSRSDSRLLLVPFISMLAFYPLVWDAGNVVAFALQYGAVSSLVLFLSSKRDVQVLARYEENRPPSLKGTTP